MARAYNKVTIKQERYVLDNYEDYRSNRELGAQIGLTPSQVRSIYRRHGLFKCKHSRFRKGHTPWNAGKKGTIPENKTSFKAGHLPHNTTPVGSLRTNKDGLLEIKYMEHKWRSLHSHIWIEANGAIPPGHVVVFKPGASKNPVLLENLQLITRAELLRRNNCK